MRSTENSDVEDLNRDQCGYFRISGKNTFVDLVEEHESEDDEVGCYSVRNVHRRSCSEPRKFSDVALPAAAPRWSDLASDDDLEWKGLVCKFQATGLQGTCSHNLARKGRVVWRTPTHES